MFALQMFGTARASKRALPLTVLVLVLVGLGTIDRAAPTSFGSWHTSLPKTTGGGPTPTANLSAVVPLLRASNQTLYGVDTVNCAQLAQLTSVLEATAGSGIRIFAVLGSHSPLHEYCSVFLNAARTDLNWSAIGHHIATAGSGYPHFLGCYIDDFYAAVEQPGHSSFSRGGVRTKAYSLAESADQLRSALRAVRASLYFIPLVYTEQFGYGLPGSSVIGALAGVPFAGSESAAVSFRTSANTPVGGAATLRLFFQNDLNAWYINASTVMGALTLSVTVNGYELYAVDAASLPNVRRFQTTLAPGILKPGGNDTITISVHPSSEMANTTHLQQQVRLSYVWGVSVKTKDGVELIRQHSAEYAVSSPSLLASGTDSYSVVGHCDAMIAMTSQDPAAYQSPEAYEDIMSDARDKAATADVELWAGHYARRGLLWSQPSSPPILSAMIASDKKLQLAGSLIWNYPLELDWPSEHQGIFSQRSARRTALATGSSNADAAMLAGSGPDSGSGPVNETEEIPTADQLLASAASWPADEVGYPGFYQRYTTATAVAAGTLLLELSDGGTAGRSTLSSQSDGDQQRFASDVTIPVREYFLKQVFLGDRATSGMLLYQEVIDSASGKKPSCLAGSCPGLTAQAKADGVRCVVGCVHRANSVITQLSLGTRPKTVPFTTALQDIWNL